MAPGSVDRQKRPELRARVRRLLNLPRTLRHRALHETGICSVCGRDSRFLAHSDNLKESLCCVHCDAWTRVRMIADVLLGIYSRAGARSLSALVDEEAFRALSIYEAQASGPLHALLRKCPAYVCSEYFADTAPGTMHEGVRCEDLQALSCDDASLDLILHSSVLEHIPRPDDAFREAHRVLRPSGRLIFEVPMTDRGNPNLRPKSVVRVDTSSGRAVHLLEPAYHDDPLDPQGVLVYTDFGLDIEPRLSRFGFDVELVVRRLESSTMSHAVVVVARKM